jgi:urease accessory protein
MWMDGALPPETASDPAAKRALLHVWLSPSFPVGAFAYSQGLEQAVERGWVRDAAMLQAWLEDLVMHGSLGNDLVLLAAAWRATAEGNAAALRAVAILSVALQPSAERHLETTQQGRSFIGAMASAWPCPATAKLEDLLRETDIGYPVAVGSATAGHGIALDDTLSAYALAFVSNAASAAIRLSVIGQTDGQRVVAALVPAIGIAVQRASRSSLDDLGSATLRADIASLAHETQYSRLFRS